MTAEHKLSRIIFLCFLFVVALDLTLQIMFRMGPLTAEQIVQASKNLWLLSVFEVFLVTFLLGILTFTGAEEADT